MLQMAILHMLTRPAAHSWHNVFHTSCILSKDKVLRIPSKTQTPSRGFILVTVLLHTKDYYA